MKAKVASISSHGINVFVNRQLVYNYPESLFAEAGIMCIEHADFEGVERYVCSIDSSSYKLLPLLLYRTSVVEAHH